MTQLAVELSDLRGWAAQLATSHLDRMIETQCRPGT